MSKSPSLIFSYVNGHGRLAAKVPIDYSYRGPKLRGMQKYSGTHAVFLHTPTANTKAERCTKQMQDVFAHPIFSSDS